jgi:hypothetical protein
MPQSVEQNESLLLVKTGKFLDNLAASSIPHTFSTEFDYYATSQKIAGTIPDEVIGLSQLI